MNNWLDPRQEVETYVLDMNIAFWKLVEVVLVGSIIAVAAVGVLSHLLDRCHDDS